MELDIDERVMLIPVVEDAELGAEELLDTTEDIVTVLLALDVPSSETATAASTPASAVLPRN